MAFLTPFSGALATEDDQRRFRRAASGLFWAGILAGFCAALGAVWVPENEVLAAFPNFWRYKFLGFTELSLWLISCLYPGRIRPRFRYIEGAAATIVAFAVISHFAFVLVLWTGGLNSSVFAATFLSLIGVAVLVPQDVAIRFILTGGVIVEAIVLVFANVEYRQHNAAVLALSLIAYVFAATVRWLLEKDQV